ncbi:LysR family transcriptional regulator [Curtobacterium sp. S6]|uniref:LysR family transcriptional regulator n=1 Tax=Curtobacterium sp. S6 TaxID=1479623 RepID=UPI00068BD0CF|nr:LysR family transcriptional regulator [Curtobacterium sp. S6]
MMEKYLNVDRLLTLRAIERLGSVTAAAADLVVTVSAVSQQVAKLEREVGLALVERHSRGIRLTEAGRALAHHAESIEKQLSAARADMDQFRNLNKGKITIATFPTFTASVMPKVVRMFHHKYPRIDVRIISSRLDGVVDALERHEADMGILWDYSWSPFESGALEVSTLLEEESMLVLPDSERFAQRDSMTIEELAEENWITRNAHPVREALIKICRQKGFDPNIVLTTSDYQELQGMVAAGVGIALAPRLATLHPMPGVKIIPLLGNPSPRRILLGWNAASVSNPTIRGARKIFFEAVKEYTSLDNLSA